MYTTPHLRPIHSIFVKHTSFKKKFSTRSLMTRDLVIRSYTQCHRFPSTCDIHKQSALECSANSKKTDGKSTVIKVQNLPKQIPKRKKQKKAGNKKEKKKTHIISFLSPIPSNAKHASPIENGSSRVRPTRSLTALTSGSTSALSF